MEHIIALLATHLVFTQFHTLSNVFQVCQIDNIKWEKIKLWHIWKAFDIVGFGKLLHIHRQFDYFIWPLWHWCHHVNWHWTPFFIHLSILSIYIFLLSWTFIFDGIFLGLVLLSIFVVALVANNLANTTFYTYVSLWVGLLN